MSSFRCPNCGGMPHHVITDVKGNTYYKCTTGLTSIRNRRHLSECDTIVDNRGRLFHGAVLFSRDGKLVTEMV